MSVEHSPRLKMLKYGGYREMPWRNGGGTTREIAREPRAGEDFAWRLSLAAIEGECDFSLFAGHRRALVLVEGTALRLSFRGHGSCRLGPAMRSVRFEGDWKSHCTLPEGPCTDLSLIVRKGSAARGSCIVRAPVVLGIRSVRRLVLPRRLYGALFALEGAIAISESNRCRRRLLRALDTALLLPGSRRTLTLERLGANPARGVFLRWRPGRSRSGVRVEGAQGTARYQATPSRSSRTT
jgi:environmental stress-induced protein Ves